jgi:hypothetical protein
MIFKASRQTVNGGNSLDELGYGPRHVSPRKPGGSAAVLPHWIKVQEKGTPNQAPPVAIPVQNRDANFNKRSYARSTQEGHGHGIG